LARGPRRRGESSPSEFGFSTQVFSSADAFLQSDRIDETNCLILDIGMPRMSGSDLQQELQRRRQKIPIIFITAHSLEAKRRDLIERGTVAGLKPFDPADLQEPLNSAPRKSYHLRRFR
jgi:FixJ family two-component response regulator